MGGDNWLLQRAIDRRQQDVVEARGKTLISDACDNGGRLRHRLSMRRVSVAEAVKVFQRPVQLDLWISA